MRAAGARNIGLVVEYDGTDFAGFQKQPGKRTVQGTLERCLAKLLGGAVKVTGAGRTDAGVHALGQVVNVRSAGRIPAQRLATALNGMLPRDVFVRRAWEAPPQFDARKSARRRTYRYLVLTECAGSALAGRLCHIEPGRLRLGAMREAARQLKGRHDYASFTTDRTRGAVRNVRKIGIRKEGGFVFITVVADAFLRQMVRALAGVLLRVGRGEMAPGEAGAILAARDRGRAGRAAPAQGLYLMGVEY